MKFAIMLFICALILSAGTKLMWMREAVTVGGHSIKLPMRLYENVPVLGFVSAPGRYMVIGYMAMAVGVAGLVSHVRQRYGHKWALAAVTIAAGLTCTDYAFRFMTVEVPVCPIEPGEGSVMDPRLFTSSVSLHRQTVHGRPLVGGYISRTSTREEKALAGMTDIGWFFQPTDRRGEPPLRHRLLRKLQEMDIRYVCIGGNTEDRRVLEASGLRMVHEDRWGATFVRDPIHKELNQR
jgi:hypothetical protein